MTTASIDKRTDKALRQCLQADRAVAVLAYDYLDGGLVPTHEHAKAQLIYAIEGTMTVTTQKGRWVLLPTRAMWVPARMRHSIRMQGRLRMRTAYFGATVAAPANGCAVVEVSPLLRELIVSMLDEPRLYPMEGRGAQMAALICSELRATQTLPLHLPWPKEARLRRVCEAMQRRPSLTGSMEMWAAHAGMSGRSLARLFRSELRMSFQEWRLQLMLLEAQIRLAQGQSSARIARGLGYDSHAAFCAMFRRQLGVTATEYGRGLCGQGS